MVDRAFRSDHLPERSDFHFRHANGSTVIDEMQTRTFDGGLQGVGRDVTELRNLEQRLVALRCAAR